MAYIGAVAPGYDPTRASVPQLDAERFNGNASTTAFTLTRQVVSPTDINVIVENVLQEPTVAYSVSGYTLNFTEAPPTGTNNIYVIYRGSGISNYAFVPDGSITFAKLANNIKQFNVDNFTANGTGSTVELTEAPASANAVIVSVDGVIQTAPTNYTLSGSTITFTGVPDNGANVVVKHIGFRTTSTVTALQASSVTATELADSSVTNAKIVSVANTKITGNIVSSQITSVANTQITGNIVSTQIAPSVTLTTPLISGNLNFDANGTSGIRLTSANTMTFHTAGTEDMRITSDGKVGIGTNNPGDRLHVYENTSYVGIKLQNQTSFMTSFVHDGLGGHGFIYKSGALDTSFYNNDVETMRVKSGGAFQFNSGYGSVATAYGCRAWVNFQGTDTVAIRAGGNVSSVTDLGTGIYQVNYTTAMPDTNYAVLGTNERNGSDSDNPLLSHRTRTTTSVVINTSRSNTDLFDMLAPTVAIIR